MTPAQFAHQEALRRIRAAKTSGQHWLFLGDIQYLEKIPEEIGQLSELRELGLGRKVFNSDLRIWEWAVDRSFTHPVVDLDPLRGLGALEMLDISFSKVSDLGPLMGFKALQTLGVSGCEQVSDLSPVKMLSALQTLNVSFTKVRDLSSLRDLIALRTLAVAGCQQVRDLGPVSGLSALETLDVNYTDVSDLGSLSSLSALKTLDVSYTDVSDLGPLSGLSALETLGVNYTDVSDLDPLSGLSTLKTLDLSYTKVSDLGPMKNLNALQTLRMSGCQDVKDLGPLSGMNALQTLDVNFTQVSDLSPLKNLSALQTLEVAGCQQVSSLSPLSGLSALQKLDVCFTRVSDLGPQEWLIGFRSLRAYGIDSLYLQPSVIEFLPHLKELCIDRVAGTPPEVLSEDYTSNCLDSFRSWWQDLQDGEEADQEIKIFVLGNGTAGKTQICRQLRGEAYDENVPSTHGVQIDLLDLMPDKGKGGVKARLWDFGGQDIYHGTHALFLEGRAVFILVWNPRLDGKGDYEENGLRMHHHGLVYWLDYVRSLAGEDAALVVVQSQCDLESDRAPAPLPAAHGFKRTPPQVTCSAKEGEMDELVAALRSASRYLLEVHGSYRLPTSWVAVRDRLRELKVTEKTISRDCFDELCRDNHGPSNPAAVLNYLHRCGELFYREGLFRDEIVLDQEWAVRAIYAVMDRKGPCQSLHAMGGVFTLPLLESLVWHDQFTPEEQQTILGMMESCAICFPLDERTYKKDEDRLRRYALPDFLPLEKDVTARVEALWRADLPAQKATLEYSFLHEGILRQLLCQIGTLGGANAAYWKYGCCFYDAATHSRARIRSEKQATPETPAKGRIIIETCEGQAGELLARLQKAVLEIRIGQPPQVMEEDKPSEPAAAREESKPLAESLKIEPAPTAKPLVYFSYAWGGEKEEMVDRLEKRLIEQGYEVKRDKRSMRPGDWISDFMREIGQAQRVCVVLSEKYLQSIYCMRELLYLYQTSCGEKKSFLDRIVPLVVEDIKLSKTTNRMKHVTYWNQELQELVASTTGLDPSMWGGATNEMAMIREFCHSIEPMLHHVNDYLMPRGIKNIEENNFAAVLVALRAKW